MKLVVLFGVVLMLAMNNAHAYLDPGSGSAILQGIIGALAAIAITLKLYWHRLLRFLGLRKSTLEDDDEDEDETAEVEVAGQRDTKGS